MKLFSMLLLLLCATSVEAQRIVYTKVFPKSIPAYVKITVATDGKATYQETADEAEPVAFQLNVSDTAQLFELAGKLDHFSKKLEAGLKVAKSGDKTFRWEDGATVSEATFNYTENEDARVLHDWFERMTETQRILDELTSTYRFDRLGVNDVLLRLEQAWKKKRLVAQDQFVALLDRIFKNQSIINMARDRAADLSDAFKAPAAQ